MNTFEIKYKGDLRTTAIHLDSGSEIITDAPKDNHGLGEKFSPTDMVCTALASCILTIMAIAVERDNIDIQGTTAVVKKTMGKNPRRIPKIDIITPDISNNLLITNRSINIKKIKKDLILDGSIIEKNDIRKISKINLSENEKFYQNIYTSHFSRFCHEMDRE